MRHSIPKSIDLLTISILILCGLFLFGIFGVNFHSVNFYNFDIYSDVIVARYIAESGTFFPSHWMFGNQFYVVATPALAALLYGICHNIYLSMSIAATVMSLMIWISFAWCIRPFAARKSIAVGLLCLMGGTILGNSAALDITGLQVFYTMASYYSCYIIGIFLTLGVWLRLFFHKNVRWYTLLLCLLFNFGLGMQSLREMLVLNLPLVALSLMILFADKFFYHNAVRVFAPHNSFTLCALGANTIGCILIRLLTKALPLSQHEIITPVEASLVDNFIHTLGSFLRYIGLLVYDFSFFHIFRFSVGIFCVCTILWVLIHIIKTKSRTPLVFLILWCIISIGAVICAGITVISVRDIYFFVWYILVSLCFVYAANYFLRSQRGLLVILAIVSSISWCCHFFPDFLDFSQKTLFYQTIADTLQEDGVEYVYYQIWNNFDASQIAACTDSSIEFCGITTNPNNFTNDDLLTRIPYLYSKQWFQLENLEKSYLLLNDIQLNLLKQEENKSFINTLLSHLVLEHQFSFEDTEYYFYSIDQALFLDMIDMSH